MKYKNEKSFRIESRKSEIRKLEKQELTYWDRTSAWVRVEPYQDGFDVYFDVAPAYKGTIFEEKVWEVLPYLMKIGLYPIEKHQSYNKNINGYSYTYNDVPELEPLNQATYESLKISHDLFTKIPDIYYGNDVTTFHYEPNFLNKLVIVKIPRIITEEKEAFNFCTTKEEAEIEKRLNELKDRKTWRKNVRSKDWRRLDRKKKRAKDKEACRRIKLGCPDDRRTDFSQEVKDMWWWLD